MKPTSLRRRDLLQIGFSTAMGLGLSGVLESNRARADQRTGKRTNSRLGAAKNVIIIYQTGGASHIDTLDPKPEAPDGVRGDFRPIASRVPGIQVAEHLPRFASQADHWAIVRSMSHKNAGHLTATHQVLTGTAVPDSRRIFRSTKWPRGRTGPVLHRASTICGRAPTVFRAA